MLSERGPSVWTSSNRVVGAAAAVGVCASLVHAQTGLPGTIDLASLNGTRGFRMLGGAAGDEAGRSVASAGDLNGDGVDDLVIGAPYAEPGGLHRGGSVYVVFGRDVEGAGPFPPALELSALNGADGFRLDGGEEYDNSGWSVARAGDVNHDGLDDLAIGVPGAAPNGAGATYVLFGRDTTIAGAFPAALPLAELDGGAGFRIVGVAEIDESGVAVASAGDINADGVDDLIIGAPGADPGGLRSAGSTYIVFGRDADVSGSFPGTVSLGALTGADGFRIDGAAELDCSGDAVASAGDFNGDGVDDVLVGAFCARSVSGSTYVVFGRDTDLSGEFPATFALASLDGANGFRLDGEHPNDRSGHSVSGAGDVNGDGVDDIIIGAYLADPGGITNAGSSYVVFGRRTNVDGPFAASILLSDLDGANGFRVDGSGGSDQSGACVGGAGDFNADGLSDVLIGAIHANPGGRSSAGITYIVYGRDTGIAGQLPATISVTALNRATGVRVHGASAGELSGFQVATAGDVNGDGVDDLITSAIRSDPGGETDAGTVYVVFGDAACLADLHIDGVVDMADLQPVLAWFNDYGVLPGDANGDGYVDFHDLNIVLAAFNTVCP